MLGLTAEGLLEDLGAQTASQFDGERFEVGKGRAPRQAIGPVEVVEQVFCRAFHDGTEVRRDGHGGGICCHLVFLSAVASRTNGGFDCPILGGVDHFANRVVRPRRATRNPTTLLRRVGELQPRCAERQSKPQECQLPPRSTRSEPWRGPSGFCFGLLS